MLKNRAKTSPDFLSQTCSHVLLQPKKELKKNLKNSKKVLDTNVWAVYTNKAVAEKRKLSLKSAAEP